MKKNNLFKVSKYILLIVLFVFFSPLKAQSIEDGLKLLDVEKNDAARKVFEDYINKNPKKTDGYFYLGKLDVIEAKTDAALEKFQKAKSIEEDDALSMVGFGMVQLAKGDTAGAWKHFDKALDETDFKNAEVMINIADAYLVTESKNYSRAIDVLNKALVKNRKNPKIYETLGNIYVRQSNGSQAIHNFRTAIDYDKNFLKAYVGIGQIYFKINNVEDAEYNISKALKLDSTYAPAYRILAEYYYSKKQYEKGSENFRKYVQFSENTPEKQVRFATMLFLSSEYDEAIKLIEQLDREGKNNDRLQHILAFSYYYKSTASEKDSALAKTGIAAFEKYFSMAKPNDISATDYEYLGKLQAKSGMDAPAVQNFQKAIAMDSSKVDLHGEIAALEFKNKNWTGAINQYKLKEQVTGKPLSLLEYFNLGQAAYRDSVYTLADSAYAKVNELKPDLALGYYWRAASNVQLDLESELGLAKPHYEKFIEIASKDSLKYKNQLIEAYNYLGYYYFLQKDVDNSTTYYNELIKLDPTHPQANDALKAFKDPKFIKSLKEKKTTKK